MKILWLIAGALLLTGCASNSDSPPETAATPSANVGRPQVTATFAPPPSLRLSGLYAAKGATGTVNDYSYLRFFQDGAVIYGEGSGPPKKWAKNLEQHLGRNVARQSAYAYQGNYNIRANKIQFEVKSSDFGTMIFEGIISKNELLLQISGNNYADTMKMSKSQSRAFKTVNRAPTSRLTPD